MKTFKTLLQIGLARQNLFANLDAYAQENTALQQNAFFKILYQHLEVVAFDAANKLVLTDKDVAAYLKYVAFSNELAGVNQYIGESEKQVFQQQLASGFHQLPLEQKQVFCSARLLWQVVDANWKQLTAAQQQQVRTNMQGQMNASNASSSSYVGGGGGAITHQSYEQQTAEEMVAQMEADNRRWAAEKGMTVEEYLEYRWGFNASMPILQRASMESHATMMNVINNLGGGNDSYWLVKDVDSSGNIIW